MTYDPSRRALLRGLGAAAMAAPLTGFLAGCSRTEIPGSASATQDLLATGRKQGFLRVGIANEPPYTQVTADGNVTGAEPDVFRAVCKRLGINDVQGVITPYASMIPGLKANRWDAIAAGLFMKQSRCAEVLYSEPVIVSTESFGVKPGNPKKITTVAGVLANADLKIAVLPGGFEDGILKTAKVPDGQLVKVDDGRSGIEALRAGRADAFFLPTLSLKALQEKDKDFEVTEPVGDAPRTGSGAAFRPTDKTFLAEYNKELAAFKATSEFAAILTKWGFDAQITKGVTAAELCKNAG
ncbi:ectoine/hydroxyectoine ABC transporter substrate-binding protein EhuB [Nonomuraea sp. NPDC049269]|uniref:ectoine/hydroxyectoine ABC transporter substrate-binding protein EhuB n=1 Tax=Nonomuraea sp. NPDC049269 TaxID=3364349 RepID=UPI003717AA7D